MLLSSLLHHNKNKANNININIYDKNRDVVNCWLIGGLSFALKGIKGRRYLRYGVRLLRSKFIT